MNSGTNTAGVHQRRFHWAWFVPFIGAFLTLASIWIPELWHYHASEPSIDASLVERLRHDPPADALARLSRFRVLHAAPDDVSAITATADAERALSGTATSSDGATIRFAIPFDVADLERGTLRWTLAVAGFAIPDRLLKGYERTGDGRYLQAAIEYAVAWEEAERSAWLQRGLMWNDHAMSERVFVLVGLWHAYRSSPWYDARKAATLIRLAVRCGDLLSRPSHFTFATNHGVMQNLALLQLAASMPLLPRAAEYARVARERIEMQMGFFIAPDGVILEHSAGYHRFGVMLLEMAQTLYQATGGSMPPEFEERIRAGRSVLAALARPDGSLPAWGDTWILDTAQVAPHNSDGGTDRCLVFPASGLSVWWSGGDNAVRSSQLVAIWSYFPGHGHKLADDLSILFWADGQSWISNVGYWSYGDPKRSTAGSWAGANGPHASGEAKSVARATSLNRYACNRDARVLDMSRVSDEGFRARRQVIQLDAATWVVLDEATDRMRRSATTNWTAFPGLDVRNGPFPRTYMFSRDAGDLRMDVAFRGSTATSVRSVIGQSEPFAGWVFMNGRPVPAPALVVESKDERAWVVSVWTLVRKSAQFAIGQDVTVELTDAEQWRIAFTRDGERRVIRRQHDELIVDDADRVELGGPSPSAAEQRRMVEASFAEAAQLYPKFRELQRYRKRVSWIVLGLLVAQVVFLLGVRRFAARYERASALVAAFAWLALAAWLHGYYFAT